MYAIVKAGGHQEKVEVGDVIQVNRVYLTDPQLSVAQFKRLGVAINDISVRLGSQVGTSLQHLNSVSFVVFNTGNLCQVLQSFAVMVSSRW